ncbi:hypothetical protein AUF78_14650 [archaeon 13_1_20CM_2_51_12]|nr:MAG: hypothetical protein AUF78_14650 [archaeon 13_1_20CM_2_51_12]
MPGFREEQTAWRAGMMVRVQSVLILLLFLWIAEEYNYNEAFQSWAAGTMGGLGFLFGGGLAAIYAGILIVLYLSPPITTAKPRKSERREMVVMVPRTRRRRP